MYMFFLDKYNISLLHISVILFIKTQDIFIDISNQHYNIEWSLSRRPLVH